MYKKTRLNNGLRIVSHSMASMQSVAIGIWIRAGGRYESAADKGISHYLEHLLFKGSKKYSCRKIKESIEGVGGALNGFTSEELTCYLVKIPAAHVSKALDILSDMVISPLLLKSDIARERTVILEEIKMYKDLPQSYVYDLLDELLWPAQPLGLSVIGSVESVSRLNRQDLLDLQKRYYTAHNIVVAAAGALRHEALVEKVARKFEGVRGSHLNAFIPVREIQREPQLKVFNKDTEQTHLALGFHGLKRDHPLRHSLALLHVILGANMSSRLFNEVREKRGLAYEIGTQVKRYHDTGAFVIHAGLDNQKVEPSLALVLKELNKIKSSLVTEDELKRAKDFYVGQLALALEETLDHMLWIGESTAALDKTYHLQEIMREVSSISRQDIREIAQKIFKKSSMNLALIGPLKQREPTVSGMLRLV